MNSGHWPLFRFNPALIAVVVIIVVIAALALLGPGDDEEPATDRLVDEIVRFALRAIAPDLVPETA